MSARHDIVDPDDFCRMCLGRGFLPEETERGTTLYEACHGCRGTGLRTVRMDLVQT